jgi:hypothetical protein
MHGTLNTLDLVPVGSDQAKDDSLDRLANHIRTGVATIERVYSNALEIGLDVGATLIVAKPQVKAANLDWEVWLTKNCALAASTAALYMRLAEHRAEIVEELKRNPDLSLRAARALLTKKRSNTGRSSAKSSLIKIIQAMTVQQVLDLLSEEQKATLRDMGLRTETPLPVETVLH